MEMFVPFADDNVVDKAVQTRNTCDTLKNNIKTSKMSLLTTLRICVHGENKKLKGHVADERTLPRKQHFVSMRNGDTIDPAATHCKISVSAWIFHGDTVPQMMS